MSTEKSSHNKDFVCISCGYEADKLFHEYPGGIIKIPHCEKCGKVVDKYVEYDLVIVSLDALLLKRHAFRHILMNSGIKSHWKFCLVLLLCEAFNKLLRQRYLHDNKQFLPDHVIYSALEIDLYWNFFVAVTELFSFLFGVILCMSLWKHFLHKDGQWPSLQECACGLMLSNFGRILVLPAMLWGQTYSILYLWLSNAFTVAANVQATRVLCPSWNVNFLTAAIVFGHCLTFCVSTVIPSDISSIS